MYSNSNSEWARKNENINTEIEGLNQRRNQNGTTDDEKAAIDRRIQELNLRREENNRQMAANACQRIVNKLKNMLPLIYIIFQALIRT